MATNDEQTAFWGGVGGGAWVDLQEQMDGQLLPLGEAAMAAANVQVGEHVLDVGCGCGATTLALAGLVGPTGAVVGCDFSGPMLARATQRGTEAGLTNASFALADVQTAMLPGPFDVVFSRFGVMFFADPIAAFANIRSATKPGGRLSFVCWQPVRLNDSFAFVGLAANDILGPPDPVPDDAPGPFAFADPDRVRAILGQAGWTDVNVAECRREIQVFGTSDLETGLAGAMRIGGLVRRLAGRSDETIDSVRDAVRKALVERWTPTGWLCDAVCWVATATN